MEWMNAMKWLLVGFMWIVAGGMAMLTALFVIGFIRDLRDRAKGRKEDFSMIWFWPVLFLVSGFMSIGLGIAAFVLRRGLL